MYLQYHDLSKTKTLVEPQPKPSHFAENFGTFRTQACLEATQVVVTKLFQIAG